MADRTDLDALLIGALYGELTPADEARLTAHLESHPADRTALAELEHTRAAVRASGLRRLMFEPPQAVSALLVQEAARRAPRTRATESWFQRFVRSLTAHPALAAAMTIVVVAGVASTLYVKRADKFGEASPADEERVAAITNQAAIDPRTEPAPPVAANATPPAAGSAASRGADDSFAEPPPPAPAAAAPAPALEKTKGEAASDAVALKQDAAANDGIVAPSSSKAAAPGKRKAIGIAVEGRELQPKDLDEQKLARADRADRDGAARPSAPSGAASGGGAPPAKPVPATVARAGAFATPPPAAELAGDVAADKADAKADAKPADGNVLGWAQRQHAQVVALVRANNCRAAASAAAEIYNRAPDFYASTVESDREIRPCLSYVTSERERVDRARAAKRGNAAADQGAAPAQAVPSATPAQVPRP